MVSRMPRWTCAMSSTSSWDCAMPEMGNQPPGKRRRGNPAMVKGGPSLNPSGRPRKLVEIEAMLDAEHRTVKNMRDVFARLKALALGEVIEVTDKEGNVVGVDLRADPRFMELYLNRILGPVKELKVDMSDWPDEMVRFFAERVTN